MTVITGGELLARALANEGIRFVFGLPCPEIDPFLAALEAHKIRFVPVRHEAAAVHMAEGMYKTTGRVAVVLGNPGPGTANLFPGLVTARHEGVPVLAISSQHRSGVVYPATPATFQGHDQIDLIRPAVKWNAPVFDWSRIPELVRMAFREMFAGRPGPVHLDIPGPTLYAEADDASAPIFPRETGRAAGPQAPESQLEAAAQRLAAARKPVIFAGTGVDRAWANAELVAVAELLGAPVIPSLAGRSAMPHDHPLCYLSQSPAADELRRNADVLLVDRLARRQPRRPLRQVLGRIGRTRGHPDRHRSASHRRVATGLAGHRLRRTQRARRTARQAARQEHREHRPHRPCHAATCVRRMDRSAAFAGCVMAGSGNPPGTGLRRNR